MKKILLIVCTALFVSVVSQAQIAKGSILIGGSIGLGSDKTEANGTDFSKQSSINLSPGLGIAVKQNLVAGIMLGYGRAEEKTLVNPSQTIREQNSFSGSVFLRKYFSLSNRFYAYGQGNAGYQNYKNKMQRFPGTETFQQNIYYISATPGIAFELSKKFHLEAGFSDLVQLSYNTKKTVQESTALPGSRTESKGKGFGVHLNASPSSQFNIGFRILFNKR